MEREKEVSKLLNEASRCGMRDTSALREVISDYFCQPASDNESDSVSSSTDTDSEASASALPLPEPVVVVDVLRESPVAMTSTAQPVPTATTTTTIVDDDEDDEDQPEIAGIHHEVDDAMERAVDLYDCVDVPQKKCHCVCKLYEVRPCISQFGEEKQLSIRYAAIRNWRYCYYKILEA